MGHGRPISIELQIEVMSRAFESESRYLAMLECASERLQNGLVGGNIAVDFDFERL
mgnify:CR=1 FL=1